MAEQKPKTVGSFIREYRERKGWKPPRLAKEIGVDPSYVFKLESDDRFPSAEIAKKLDGILDFDFEDRLFFYMKALPDFELPADLKIEGEIFRKLRRAARDIPTLAKFLLRAPYLSVWGQGRIYHLIVDLNRALPRLKWVLGQAERMAPLEFLTIILHDVADAYAIAGELDEADELAKRCEVLAEGRLRQCINSKEAWLWMTTITRAIVMQQQVAYERGLESCSRELHNRLCDKLRNYQELRGYNENHYDHYACAKSYYLLSLFRFWDGEFDEAEEEAKKSFHHASRIKWEDSLWLLLRDGFFLGEHWWKVHCLSLRLDIHACAGKSETAEFRRLLGDYQAASGLTFWARQVPPFVPKYSWIYSYEPASLDLLERTLAEWDRTSERLSFPMYRPDVLISWGDFLKLAKQDDSAADAKYQQASEVASRYGFGLLEKVAARRLVGHGLPNCGILQDLQKSNPIGFTLSGHSYD